MQTLLLAGTLFQAAGQVYSGITQSNQLKSQAKVIDAQADAKIALEKASAAEKTLDRLRQLRQTTGRILATSYDAGISVSSGTVGSLVNDSQYQYSRDQNIQDFNLNQSTSSIRSSADADISVLRARATNARVGGFLNAAGTLMNYGMNRQSVGNVPEQGNIPIPKRKPV